jgi:hypothetical protein
MASNVDLSDEISDDDEQEFISKKRARELLRKQTRLHEKELKKELKNAQLERQLNDLSNDKPTLPTLEKIQQDNSVASQIQEDTLMSAAADNPVMSNDATQTSQATAAAQSPQAMDEQSQPAQAVEQPAASQQAVSQTPAAQPNNSLLNKLDPQLKNAIMQEAIEELKQQERQALLSKTQEELALDKNRIIEEMRKAMSDSPDFKEAVTKFDSSYDPQKATAILFGMVDLLAASDNAVDVVQKMMEDDGLMNQYISLDGDVVKRAKLLNRVQNQVVSEKFSSIPNGNKGDFVIPSGSSPSKSVNDMTPEEFRSYNLKNNTY